MELQRLDDLKFEIIEFREGDYSALGPDLPTIDATNGDSFLCCFSFHFHSSKD